MAVYRPYSYIKTPEYVLFLMFNRFSKESLRDYILIKSLKHAFKDSKDTFNVFLNEINENDLVPNNSPDFSTGNLPSTFLSRWLYCVIRYMKPTTIVETGVSHGFSSWIILNAIRKNKKGKLYSIDLPDNDTNKNYNINTIYQETGWLVPDELKNNWTLIEGDSKIILPDLLKKLDNIDIFFHDSFHSYEHMMFEYSTSFKFINTPGMLISDDIHKNNAFSEFSRDNKGLSFFFRKGGAILK